MKKFTVMILCVSIFFIGLGGLVETVGARFKSDERAIEIMRLARQAIGGEENIKAVQSLSVTGKAMKTFEFEKDLRIERGDWELNLQMPNKISKMMRINTENNVGNNVRTENTDKQVDVVIVRKGDGTENQTITTDSPQKVVVIRKGDGNNMVWNENTNTNGETRNAVVTEDNRGEGETFQRNDFFRTAVSLLLTSPQGNDADYVYAGETNVDGTNCEIVQINSGGTSVKLFLNKSTHLPVMMSYTDAKPLVFRVTSSENNSNDNNVKVIVNNPKESQTAEFQVKFSDYRAVNGLQFPFKWTQTIDGKADESIEVSAYQINPANIAEKFKELPQKIMIRTEKP
ncbi:hypothetical protein BH10ACI1_BH10ACI1_32890 [soil metagenome]